MELCGAFQNRIFLFLCASLSGILFALVWRKYEQTVQFSSIRTRYSSTFQESNYDAWLQARKLSSHSIPAEILSYDNVQISKVHLEKDYLFGTTSIFCLVFATSHKSADAVKQTWAKHCNIVKFFGKFIDEKIPVLKVPPVTSFEGFCYAFMHVYMKYHTKFDWIFIADDSTYANVENLRHFVAPLNSSTPYYFGHAVRDYGNLYNLGSAGIVLSKGSSALLNSVYLTADDCLSKRPPSWYFDQSIGRILMNFNVHPVDTRDSHLRSRFNPFSIEKMIIPGSISVFSSYWRNSPFLSEEGMNCCSDRAITFHGMTPMKLYLMEYLQFHLSAFRDSEKGVGNHPSQSPDDINSKSFHSSESMSWGVPHVELLGKKQSRRKKLEKSTNTKSFSLLNSLFGD